ncbi:unnamed protein product [Polarella glacialis]|uniref:Uncharacterized protein n=1 Tax=Polarella glacialis TaxID=89957 RepID=A0A813GUJ3_POLGL|nr:unnamed protein product [Polarella glacialis]
MPAPRENPAGQKLQFNSAEIFQNRKAFAWTDEQKGLVRHQDASCCCCCRRRCCCCCFVVVVIVVAGNCKLVADMILYKVKHSVISPKSGTEVREFPVIVGRM